MSINLKELTIKNFLSIGNATQAVDLQRTDLTLVLGENLDLGGDGSRNGVGKTAALNAISYALYGSALSNIRRGNLVNKTNGKGMLVTLTFDIHGQEYRIERGRGPNILKFFVGDSEQEFEDNAQGDSRETQAYLDRLLGLSHDMFKHIVALNTYSEPFLSQGAGAQRAMIEQLLGITQLSERGDKVKELIRGTKDLMSQEEFKIKAINEANKRIEEQISSLRQRQKLWLKKKTEDCDRLASAIDALSHVDIDAELAAHAERSTWLEQSKQVAELKRWVAGCESDMRKHEKTQAKLDAEIAQLEDHKCYACGQDFHDDKHTAVLEQKQQMKQEAAMEWLTANTQWTEHTAALQAIGEIGVQPETFYPSLDEAYQHRSSLENLQQQLLTRAADQDPYIDQINDMEHRALQEVNYDTLNELGKLNEHQEFLFKLLTNKDSFLRKKIIEQNLAYLNGRLTHYLENMGLPHSVTFQNDLSVLIEELGRELDFDNLSRGERNRLILSLSWAFRDVWEALNSPINLLWVDELLDNGLDTQGVEAALGLLKGMSRERSKSIWLVSHRDELIGRVENTLMVRKENGFSSLEMVS